MTAAVKPKPVWKGAKALRRHLVPIASLEPFPGNPRIGHVEDIRASLRRFGQTKPILVDAADPTRIVAGHHVTLAAGAEGYTHVAALAHEFADEAEARAYLIADNRTHDVGSYDLENLHAQLAMLQQHPQGLEGTGYADGHVTDLEAQLVELRRQAQPPPEFPPLDPGDLTIEHVCPSCGYEWSGKPAPGAEEPEAA